MGVRAREIVDRYPVADFEHAWLDVLSPRALPLRVRVADLRAGVRAVERRLQLVRRTRARLGIPTGLSSLFTLHR